MTLFKKIINKIKYKFDHDLNFQLQVAALPFRPIFLFMLLYNRTMYDIVCYLLSSIILNVYLSYSIRKFIKEEKEKNP